LGNFQILLSLFVAQKRQSSVRKQQLSNGYPPIETDRLPDEQTSNIISQASQSIPFLNQTDSIRYLNNGIDSYSFTDIEVASSINERKTFNPNATPKSIASHNRSLATTNLSAYSTQSLLRKLLDKAQALDEYYKDLSHKPSHHSSSLNSLLSKSDSPSRTFLHRYQSNESMRKSQRKKYRNLYDNISSDNSRFNLYDDEDNILRELIRFNNDIDLILSRLDTEGESIEATTNDPPTLNENPLIIDPPPDENAPVNNDQ